MLFCKCYVLFLRTIILGSKSSSNRERIAIKQEVYRAVEQKKKREYILGICLISGVSLVLVGMAVYVFVTYIPWSFTFELPKFPKMNFTPESKSMYGFSIYIALLSLTLIGLDHYLRHKWMMRKNK